MTPSRRTSEKFSAEGPVDLRHTRGVPDLGELPSCASLTSEDAKVAAASAAEMRKLLRRVAEIAEPDGGSPKVLMAVARLSGQEWVEGDLRVELSGDDASTSLSIFSDHGSGIRERILPETRLRVPLDEFSRALSLAPRMVFPLRVEEVDGKIVLVPLASDPNRTSLLPSLDLEIEVSGPATPHARTTAPPPADELMPVDTGDALGHLDPLDALDALEGFAPLDVEPPTRRLGDSPTGATAAVSPLETLDTPGEEPSPPSSSDPQRIHTRPTVPRMVAIDPAMLKRRDPRREEDD